MIGEQILNYKILSQIGEGGMGSVYLAAHIQLNRKAAIKALHQNLARNPIIRERFKNEAATMAHLRHPGIVALYDYLETPQALFLIMEYVEGKALDTYIRQVSGPIPEDKTVQFFIKILDAFEYAHNQGVIHRDIKPSNLIITPEEDIKVLDFGIAKLLDGSSKSLTKTGTKMGTVLYMSPEQVKGQEIDRRSDVYALGVTLFQMLTGRSPYNETQSTEYEVYHQIVNTPLPQAQTFYPKVSDWMQDIIDYATAKNPQERFQNCMDFKKALLSQSTLLTTPAYETVLGGKPYLGKTSPQLGNIASMPDNKKDKKRNWLLILLIFLIFSTATAAFVLFNPLDISFLRSAAAFNPLNDSKESIKIHLEKFYKAVESHDFEQLKGFYRNKIDNYFGNLNRSLSPDIKAAYQIYWKDYIAERHEIDWEAYDYEQDTEGNHLIRLQRIVYYFKTNKEDWQKIQTKAEIKMDKDWKVYFIRRF